MAGYIIIDFRNKKVYASPDAVSGEDVTLLSVDLITDAWEDFRYFLDAAVRYENGREFSLRNRYLRTAMMYLFAHFDGIVSGVCDRLAEEGHIDPRFSENGQEKCSVKSKFFAILDLLKNRRGSRLPYVNFDLKPIRDIINHPSVTKPKSGDCSVLLTHIDVYGVDIREVVLAGKQIDQWLNRICELTCYQRFIDTKAAMEKFLASLENLGATVQRGKIEEF